MRPTYSEIFVFCIGLGLFWFAFLTVYRKFTIDIFRQKMFELRDSVFDYAARGNVSFDHPAYKLLRTAMNGFLRYGHKISLFELFIISIGTRDIKKVSFSKQWNKALHGIPDEQREEFETFRKNMNELIVLQAFAGSPFFLCTVIAPIATIAVPARLYKSIKETFYYRASRWLRIPIDRVESTALVYGK